MSSLAYNTNARTQAFVSTRDALPCVERLFSVLTITLVRHCSVSVYPKASVTALLIPVYVGDLFIPTLFV